jgi:Large ribosomal RNA subunit accumulation protein YceD
MRDHKSDRFAPAPWRVPVAVADVAEDGQTFVLDADAQVRAAVARMAGLRELPRLQAEFKLTPQASGGLRVVGRVSATVGQDCVVTLEPIINAVEGDVDLLFVPQPAVSETAAEGGGASATEVAARWGDPEPLVGGAVDLGALATEFLILGLDPYPRKPGAVFDPPHPPDPDSNPFAALAGWAKDQRDH